MTTTSVKDVGSVLNSGVIPGSAASKAAEGGFQTVWDSQAGADRAEVSYGADSERTIKPKDDTAKPGDDLRARDNSRKDIGKEQTVESRKADELDTDDLEKAAELAGTAAVELIQQIADTFGVSVEEVQEIMADMNLQPTDLLQTENLSALLLQVSGAENSLALLTNEQLYADYQKLMEQGSLALKQCSEAMDMNPEEFVQAIAQMTGEENVADAVLAEGADEEPVIEIAAEDDDAEVLGLQGKDAVNAQAQVAQNLADAQGNQQDGAQDKNSRQNAHTENGNLVLQTIRNENAQPQTVEVQAPTATWSTQTQDIMRQIMDFMRIQVKPDMSSLEMQLHPESLGTLQVQVASKGGVLTANFVTENETVKAAIESQMVQLKESFAEQGVKVEAIEVTVQTHQFEQNLEQGRGRQSQEEPERRTRTRKIDLSGLDGLNIPKELEAEDQLTAEMMAANGQTVDYTA